MNKNSWSVCQSYSQLCPPAKIDVQRHFTNKCWHIDHIPKFNSMHSSPFFISVPHFRACSFVEWANHFRFCLLYHRVLPFIFGSFHGTDGVLMVYMQNILVLLKKTFFWTNDKCVRERETLNIFQWIAASTILLYYSVLNVHFIRIHLFPWFLRVYFYYVQFVNVAVS